MQANSASERKEEARRMEEEDVPRLEELGEPLCFIEEARCDPEEEDLDLDLDLDMEKELKRKSSSSRRKKKKRKEKRKSKRDREDEEFTSGSDESDGSFQDLFRGLFDPVGRKRLRSFSSSASLLQRPWSRPLALKKLLIFMLVAIVVTRLFRGAFAGSSDDVSPAPLQMGPGDSLDESLDDNQIPEAGEFKSKRISKKDEIAFACKETECIEKCARKTTKKCKASESCMKTRVRDCRKKCRKVRCMSRCKDESSLGYVEREIRQDKCMKACNGATKCLEKCQRETQPCKSRCAERRKKFTCDKEPDVPFPNQQNDASSVRTNFRDPLDEMDSSETEAKEQAATTLTPEDAEI